MSRYIVAEGNLTRPPRGGHGQSGKAWAHLDIAVAETASIVTLLKSVLNTIRSNRSPNSCLHESVKYLD